ncbi:hypothetical protein B481_1353 [Planococcus halocryophilus Or1]|uniref:Uncharacterized protein n=2 Tax=Planococcus halocryophilus TaxID=1215089 RepID=A0A1C7DUZ7_9BACL|nr:hypothetical protein [Planococcus halocryophilus]ANU15232.1 hypothetical protein BBI08_15830 [Planococcus halocryophilus]EMF46966.1 hypothetical protein B481_1353 [Planococcus halocryophilus Or1]
MDNNAQIENLKLYIDFEEGLLLKDFTLLLNGFNSLHKQLSILTLSESKTYKLIEILERRYYRETNYRNRRSHSHVRNSIQQFSSRNTEPLAIKKFSEGSLWIELISNPLVTDLLLPILSAGGATAVEEILRPKFAKFFRNSNPENSNIENQLAEEITDSMVRDCKIIHKTLSDSKIKQFSLVYEDGKEIEIRIK